MSKQKKYFSYNGDGVFTSHHTPERAKAAAQRAIEEYRVVAFDGWQEEVEGVCWGEIVIDVSEMSRISLTGGYFCWDIHRGFATFNRISEAIAYASACIALTEGITLEKNVLAGRIIERATEVPLPAEEAPCGKSGKDGECCQDCDRGENAQIEESEMCEDYDSDNDGEDHLDYVLKKELCPDCAKKRSF